MTAWVRKLVYQRGLMIIILVCSALGVLQAQTISIWELTWQPNGNLLAVGLSSGEIQLVNSVNGQIAYSWQAHSEGVLSLAWTSDGNWLASGGYDETVKVWNIIANPVTATAFTTLVQGGIVSDISWSPLNDRLVSIRETEETSYTFMWQVNWQNSAWSVISDDMGSSIEVAWNQDASKLAFANYDQAILTSGLDLSFLGVLNNPDPIEEYLNIYHVAWQPNTNYIATAGARGMVRLWDGTSHSIQYSLQANDSEAKVLGISYSANGATLYSFSEDGTLRGWNTNNGTVVSNQQVPGGPFTQVAWSTDAGKIAAISSSGTPQITQTGINTIIHRINAGGSAVTSNGVAWSPESFRAGGNAFVYPSSLDILQTTDDALYHDERRSTNVVPDNQGAFSYTMPVDPGTYTLRLHFAEMYFTEPSGIKMAGVGQRIFNVEAEGQAILTNFDISAAAASDYGLPAPQFRTAVIREAHNIAVTDGYLNVLLLSGSANRPTVSAVEVIQTGTLPPPPTDPTNAVYRINVGGTAKNVNGLIFAADTGQYVSTSAIYPTNITILATVAGPLRGLYHSERTTLNSGQTSFTYSLPVTNGTYKVKLHFAEIWYLGYTQAGYDAGGPNQGTGYRQFDVLAEGNIVLDEYDITREAGSQTADVVTISNIVVSDGNLTLEFRDGAVDYATLSALEVFAQ